MAPHTSVWLLLDDRPGNAGQVRGVAAALKARWADAAFVEKHVAYTALGKLPNIVRGASLVGVSEETARQLQAPWPDVVIAAGRRTAPVARWIKKAAGRRVVLAHIMNPGGAGAGAFDLIAVPNHDCVRPAGDASNVLRVTGAPHRFSPAVLADEARAWREKLAALPRPWVAVLVGGATRRRPFTAEQARELGARVSAMARAAGASVLLATSRRTGAVAEAALAEAISQPHVMFAWGRDQGAPNPYGAFIALADAVVATGDSVSMVCEACANPGPVYIYAPPGLIVPKHARLHAELYALGAARPFAGTLEHWTHAPLNAADVIAARIGEVMAGGN